MLRTPALLRLAAIAAGVLFANCARAADIPIIWDLTGQTDGQTITVTAGTPIGDFDLILSGFDAASVDVVPTAATIHSNGNGMGIQGPDDANNNLDNGTSGSPIVELLSFDLPVFPSDLTRLELTLQGLGANERAYVGASNDANPTDMIDNLQPLVGGSVQVAGSSNTFDSFLLDIATLENYDYLIVGADRNLDSGNTRYRANALQALIPEAVPEPASTAMLGLGLAGLSIQRRRRVPKRG